jgi:hypothetical protein
MKLKKYKHGGSSKKQSNSYLKGGQVKLDKNNDGELTEEDFKLLRKQKTSMKTKKKSLYAEYGALVKAMKSYENGGETDPPKKGGTFDTVTVVDDKATGKEGLVKTLQWKGNSLNKAMDKVDFLIDYNIRRGVIEKGEEAEQFREKAHTELARGNMGNLRTMLTSGNFMFYPQGVTEGTPSARNMHSKDFENLRLGTGLVEVEPSMISKTDEGVTMEQLTPGQSAEVKRMQKETGDPERGFKGRRKAVLLPDGTPSGQFSEEMLSEFGELGAPKDRSAAKPKKESKPSSEYDAGVKAFQADLRAANETLSNLKSEYSKFGKLGKNSKKAQDLKAEIDAITNDRKKLRRLGSDLSDSKGFADYESKRNEIEFEY